MAAKVALNMYLTLKKSSFEPQLFEVWEHSTLVAEISITFSLKKFPASFESLDAIYKWLQEIEKKIARQSAYGSLSLKNHSSQGLLIEELKASHLLQDDEFIRSLIEKELRSGHGPRYIEAKLRSQGLATDQVRKIVTVERQREAIAKLLGRKSKIQKAALLRRGFDFQVL